MRHIVAERDYANYDSAVFLGDNLDSEGEDQETDDESYTDSEDEAPVFAPFSRPVPGGYYEGSDISDWESDTEEDPESGEGEEHLHRLDFVEEIARSGRFNEGAMTWLQLVMSHGLEYEAVAYLRNYIAQRDNLVIVEEDLDSDDEDQESDEELQGYMSDWGSDSDNSTEHEAPALAPSSSRGPVGSRRRLREEESDDWTSSKQFRCCNAVPQAVSSSDPEEKDPESAPSSRPVAESSKKRARDEDEEEEEDGSDSKRFRP
ncbi:uncharacterized protein LOC125015430 isoform X2 [Mugil cephalus]|nr:uncharacterized protein LOC125015430 isoform X2 [Mugil cephalus]